MEGFDASSMRGRGKERERKKKRNSGGDSLYIYIFVVWTTERKCGIIREAKKGQVSNLFSYDETNAQISYL